MEYEIAFLQALILTVILEVIASAALKYFFGRRLSLTESYSRFIIIVALASIITLPYIWFILPAFVENGINYIVISELTVVIVEAVWYKFSLQTSIKTAIILSIIANSFSYLIGNVIL